MVKDKELTLLICVLFFLMLNLTSMSRYSLVRAVTPTMSLVPSSQALGLEQNLNVNITVSDVSDLYGWEFTLVWNPLLLEALEVVEGPFLREDGRLTFFTSNVNSASGRMVVGCTLLGWISGVSGSGILSTLTFHTKDYGECPLELYNVSLIDSSEQPIPCLTSNAVVQIVSPHDVAVDLVDASPLLAPIGDPVNIDVTVQNQGSYAEATQVTVYINSTSIGTQQTSVNVGSVAHVFFTWNTTAYAKGDYLILATIDSVPGETDFADNTKTAGSLVTLLISGHDVSIVAIKPAKTVIGQGYDLVATVKVGNYGAFEESFDVTACTNATVLGSQTVNLSSGSKTDVIFVQTSSSLSEGIYTLSAFTSVISGEIETGDNTLSEGLVVITIPGDIQGDFVVDIIDAILLANAFNSEPSDPYWNANADINDDRIVDILDAITLANHFGQEYS